MSRRIAVVGGGAAGMAAAVHAARAGAKVEVYERNDRVGRKILSTGNGRCNFSNEKMDSGCYHGSGLKLIEQIYQNYGVTETKAFFEGLGMRIKDRGGYLYPASGQASTVLDVLRYELEQLSVTIHTQQKVIAVVPLRNGKDAGTDDGATSPKGRIRIETADHTKRDYDAVILACGGKAAPNSGSDGNGYILAEKLGHRIVPVVPALTALHCKETFFRRVSGVRCDADLTLYIDGCETVSDRGELQWTEYGISGIPVFQLSRDAAYALRKKRSVSVRIDLMPDLPKDAGNGENDAFWNPRWERQSGQTMERFVTGLVNKKLGLLLLKLAGIGESERVCDVTDSRRKELTNLFRSLIVSVKGTNSFEQAQVSAGGVDCREVTPQLESRLAPGVYFAGEILDVDGICGGYNLQWAWSSGFTAGRAAAKQTVERP